METIKNDVVKIPNMIMCGDHPSFIKTELNVKEGAMEGKGKEKEKMISSRTRITPTPSSTEAREFRGGTSEHALRLLAARRRSLDLLQRPGLDISAPANNSLVKAALGSFRWPPYLLAVWVLVLVLTHVLHCLVGLLERGLPSLRKFCLYFRTWVEDSWKAETDLNHRIYPMALACLTGILYTFYFGLYAVYSIAVWSIEPLCCEVENKQSSNIIGEAKITNYVEMNSKSNSSVKQ